MKKGFTLVEVLSIITILGIIVLLVLPKISDSNKEKKQKEYDKLVEIIENAAKSYLSSHNDFSYVSINKLISDEYLTTNIINPFTNERMDGCIKRSEINGINKYLLESPCNLTQVQLTIDLNSGQVSENQEGTYYEGEIINLITPVNGIYEFSHWSVKRGNSTISGNILTIGTTNTEIKANYITPNVTVTFNANGGTVNPATKEIRYLGEYGNLPIPTKTDYSFVGWYTQINGGTRITSTSTVDTLIAHTLYAHWIFEE